MTAFYNTLARFINKVGVKLLDYSNKIISNNSSLHQSVKLVDFDILPKDTHVFGAANKYLLVPKNRYKMILLPDQEVTKDFGVGWLTEANTPESYDQLWGNEENLKDFREEAGGIRNILTNEIADVVQDKVKTNMDIIDIGCGSGDLLAEIVNHVPVQNISGLDFSSKAIEAAQVIFPSGNFKQFVIKKELPYASSSFDIVMCTDVLEHLEYPRVVVNELVRICRPGGHVFVVVPDGDVDQFLGHYWFWNEESLETLFKGFVVKISRLSISKEFIITIRGK